MEKLDLKDRKIIHQLQIDSRQSFRSLGRKVGLSKDVVTSRVKNLQEKGIISMFCTSIDYSTLGLIPLRFYFKYQYVTPTKRKQIINHFVNCKYSLAVASIEGNYDLYVLIIVKKINDISSFWKKTLNDYGDFFSERIFSVYLEDQGYRFSFLLDEEDDRTKFKQLGISEMIEFDDLDFKILKIISVNSRTPTLEIAKKLNTTSKTINNRIKKLIDSGVINRFSILIDFGKIGYIGYKVDIYLKEYSKIHQIIKYIEKNPHLGGIDSTLGYVDLEIELILKNINQLHEIIEDISTKFPNSIRNYTYFRLIETHKYLVLDL
jgi:DNA-binding Lrp family transcriptional regulator